MEAAWILARGTKKHISEILHDGQWAGQPSFLIGGGPSLTGFNFERLRGRRTIAINRTFEFAPFADLLFSMDFPFYQWCHKYKAGSFSAFSGARIFLDALNSPFGEDVHYIRSAGLLGFPAGLKTGIYSSNNSGYGALQLAICLGAGPIYLLGFDMHDEGPSHFHNGYPGKFSGRPNKSFRRGFEVLAPQLQAKGIRVINLNPTSGLRCFEFKTIEEVLDAFDKQPETAAETGTDKADAGPAG